MPNTYSMPTPPAFPRPVKRAAAIIEARDELVKLLAGIGPIETYSGGLVRRDTAVWQAEKLREIHDTYAAFMAEALREIDGARGGCKAEPEDFEMVMNNAADDCFPVPSRIEEYAVEG